MGETSSGNPNLLRKADWELDFYSRPILESDGKKRWELLITSTQDLTGREAFRWEKKCPAGEVNSIWLTAALQEALDDAQRKGWNQPMKLRCWRTSMKTMIKKAASKVGLEVVPSRRTYSLLDWLIERERDVYPNEEGYMAGPLAPPPSPVTSIPLPLPEAMRGDAWSLATIPLGMLKEAQEWTIEFNGLLPIKQDIDESIEIPGLRLFSKKRALALAGRLGGLEPSKLVIEGSKLLLEAGQEDAWLVTDLQPEQAKTTQQSLVNSRKNADGLHFIAIQTTPEDKSFAGFWMLRDIPS